MKKKRRKRKKQTCGLAVLLVAMDGVVVADRGADWLVVLLSFFAFPLCFLFLLLCSSSCSLFYSFSPSLVLSNFPWFKIQLSFSVFFSFPLFLKHSLPYFLFFCPPFVCLYFLLSFSFMFPLKFIIFPRNPPLLFLFVFFFFALHLLCISNNSFPSLTFISSFHLSLSCIYRRSGERATPTQSNRVEWVRWLGGHWTIVPRCHRACLLCLFIFDRSMGVGHVGFGSLGERGKAGKKQGNKPLLPLPLRVQGKKENSIVQKGTVSFFFLRWEKN